ncbi:MAG: DUF4296 domain-containing protein [Alistipes sp.]
MKRIFRITVFAFLLLFCGACARHKIIPDKVLAQIFHDAFLANAYIDNGNLRIDSLNIYEPIFATYGYTTDDVQYTIGNFSKRKSARLGDVVELSIDQLESEGKAYDREVAALDTIDNVARRSFTRTLRADSVIRVRALRDTARLRISLDVVPGEYTVSLNYLVDSLDRNEQRLTGTMWLEDRQGTRSEIHTTTLYRNREDNFLHRVTADTTHRRLHFNFVNFNAKPQKTSVTVTNFKITHTPPSALAVDSLYARQLNIRIFADEFFRAANSTDSL